MEHNHNKITKVMNCTSKSYVETGTDNTSLGKRVFSNISNKKVSVSFSVKDCEKASIDTLEEGQLDQIIQLISPREASKLSLSEKKKIILKHGLKFTASSNAKQLQEKDVKYYEEFFKHLECLKNLKFEIVKDQFNFTHTEDFKVSICILPKLTKSMKHDALIILSAGSHPKQCYIVLDEDISNSEKLSIDHRKNFENTLSHEFGHCLSL